MIRFSYSQIEGRLSCFNCSKRKSCNKEREQKKIGGVCEDFSKNGFKPEIKDSEVDYKQLIYQLSSWNIIANGIKDKYMMSEWFKSKIDMNDTDVTYSECDVFLNINRIFMEYLFEHKDMLVNSQSILEVLLQTVYSVNEKKILVKIYTEDKLLYDKIYDYVKKTDYILKKYSYEMILGIEKDSVMSYIIF